MHNCADCKKDGNDKKHEGLSSRISSMRWHMEDYDRSKGKGRFKKDHPDSQKMFDSMLDEKTKLITKHMGHDIPTEKSLEDNAGSISVGVYRG